MCIKKGQRNRWGTRRLVHPGFGFGFGFGFSLKVDRQIDTRRLIFDRELIFYIDLNTHIHTSNQLKIKWRCGFWYYSLFDLAFLNKDRLTGNVAPDKESLRSWLHV
ncbi:hypothetical protein PHYBLDRAFT_165303 [Phycomyces blakesleeanus NRRL 1555(-)]|uniref:Uncharacterized protein n=1 Tax=Phycomyces blakesleeanus (strain ATCC 8743b / DSM 1359 / FGSC 10004 / NBRC 33097 / NRRL 1555) TaxID=763407 RepID=A0A167NX33_PHYB8|nr:hypothetical protein PHYBLDRAFT_165303 [Phycomyces blakesleeanus NRRL 1555(-)]OAD76799.1 hypothetical protein PHYBLDRAFT_165303 [Phycomyces blakesleeanus NRRL 1555(-)]|eukprot:XP_018294839.1 hypothetical protein PHYBLDRAFT_165303 [Phycomyces blakesleeanus NRRL 1555(-)]